MAEVKPRIESLWFGEGRYERMARVFDATARRYCPDWDINVRNVDQRDIPRHRAAVQGHVSNTQKLEDWNQIVQHAPDGARILLIDADTFLVNPIDDIWDRDFDIAYTTKRSTFPFNLGVIFVRATVSAKQFFAAWTAENRHMLQKKAVHREYRQRFGGINQASFGRTLETDAVRGVNLLGIPCVEWNCEDRAWERFDPERTRIVHVKSALRRAIFDGTAADLAKPGVRRLAEMWKQIEAELMEPA